jgi:hypothetical protein
MLDDVFFAVFIILFVAVTTELIIALFLVEFSELKKDPLGAGDRKVFIYLLLDS